LLAHGRWFSPDTPASSITKTGHHDIAEILLNVVLNIKNQSINQPYVTLYFDVPVLCTGGCSREVLPPEEQESKGAGQTNCG
jgi:hypothetical protein